MTTTRRRIRIEIRACTDPTGRQAVLFQVDDAWHLVLPPHDALDLAETLTVTAAGVLADHPYQKRGSTVTLSTDETNQQ